jgi:hypothetical protein
MDHKDLERGDRAKKFLESEEWIGAWAAYEAKLLQEFKACASHDVSRLQQIKMLQLAGEAAKSHLERLMVDGQFAAKNIEFQAKQTRMQRVMQAIK